MLSVGVAPNVSLSVVTAVDIGNSFASPSLAAFARSISFTLAGHSGDHDVCSPPDCSYINQLILKFYHAKL
jgi:hypothetical protein